MVPLHSAFCIRLNQIYIIAACTKRTGVACYGISSICCLNHRLTNIRACSSIGSAPQHTACCIRFNQIHIVAANAKRVCVARYGISSICCLNHRLSIIILCSAEGLAPQHSACCIRLNQIYIGDASTRRVCVTCYNVSSITRLNHRLSIIIVCSSIGLAPSRSGDEY